MTKLSLQPSTLNPFLQPRLHIKNLRPVVREDDMRGIFKPFGEFEDFQPLAWRMGISVISTYYCYCF